MGDISERCGYRAETYLKVLFKKRFGMTMTEFRRNG
jgi:YesN/AraC family two-component response regulator